MYGNLKKGEREKRKFSALERPFQLGLSRAGECMVMQERRESITIHSPEERPS